MVQVKGSPRRLTQRFSRDFAGSVKYSTSCPSRRDAPSEARRAMPTSGDFCGSANKGRVGMGNSPFVRQTIRLKLGIVKREEAAGKDARRFGLAQGRRPDAGDVGGTKKFTRHGWAAGFSTVFSNKLGSTAGLISSAEFSAILES